MKTQFKVLPPHNLVPYQISKWLAESAMLDVRAEKRAYASVLTVVSFEVSPSLLIPGYLSAKVTAVFSPHLKASGTVHLSGRTHMFFSQGYTSWNLIALFYPICQFILFCWKEKGFK